MTIKKYEAIYSCLSTFVYDEYGERHDIVFKGGISGNVKIGGNFVTSDENLQKAIESDKRFKIEFKLKETHIIDDIKTKKEDVVITSDNTDVVDNDLQTPNTDYNDSDVEVVESVMNKQDARIYFRDVKSEVGMSNILSANAIEALCNKHNVSFPNLTK